MNIALESLCSVVIAIMLLFSLTEQAGIKENRFFFYMVLMLLVMLLSDLVCWLVPYSADFIAFAYGFLTLNYMSGYVAMCFFVHYLYEYIKDSRAWMRLALRCVDVSCVFFCLLCLWNLRFGFFFSISTSKGYSLGNTY